MKKIMIVLLCILMGNILLSREIKNNNYKVNNIEINYPTFNNKNIDNYIYSYISIKKNNSSNLFIDYDYNKQGHIIDINFYNYNNISNVIKYKVDSFKIDLETNSILKSNNSFIMNNYNYLEQDIIDSSKPMIAFTFDDGPNYNTNKLINILNKYNVRATFFILGSKAIEKENIIKKMNESNMEIGNHTYSHKLLTRMQEDKIKEEIDKTNNIINNIIGESPSLLRPSYGSINKRIKKEADMPIILWNIDTLDWKNHNSKRIANYILKKAKDGDIILLHDVYSASVNAIDIVIPKLLEKGYQIVTVSELAYYKNVELEKNKVYRYIK